MAKIAFLGLAQMGAPMASRLLRAGHQLTVWNRTPDRAQPLAVHRHVHRHSAVVTMIMGEEPQP
jgi:3-hydroxyisobutyrate dehydrogenase-like beta-hydroxyacid dehydrogenase